jgi:hypothetical protein
MLSAFDDPQVPHLFYRTPSSALRGDFGGHDDATVFRFANAAVATLSSEKVVLSAVAAMQVMRQPSLTRVCERSMCVCCMHERRQKESKLKKEN